MNSEKTSFDPMTGQPINNVNNQDQDSNIVQTNVEENTTTDQDSNNNDDTKDNKSVSEKEVVNPNVQSIATVDQPSEQFINNVQTDVEKQNTEKKEKANYFFIVILFIVIFAAIFFLFPLLSKFI